MASNIMAHWDRLNQEYAKEQIFGVFLYGSQNYGLATPTSDTDTVALVIPNLQDMILRNAHAVINKRIAINDIEYMTVKDIQTFISELYKQNPNALEILATDIYILNGKYEKQFLELRQMTEQIVHYDERRAVSAMHSMLCAHYYDYLKTQSEKKWYQTCRLSELLYNYLLRDKPYGECLKTSFTRDNLPDINSSKFLADQTYNSAVIMAKNSAVERFFDKWVLSFYGLNKEINE